jgi:hypothetical protein
MNTTLNNCLRFCIIFAAAIITSTLTGFSALPNDTDPEKDVENGQSIMLALLLDTSNSMDGLIDQAKSQLWKIANELASSKCSDGRKPSLKIALYEYGNSGLPASEGYIRQVSSLTDDLDVISEKLFALTTNGGNEFCGQVIKTSLRELDWSSSTADLKLIFIAGNEPFTQGEVPYTFACDLAKEKNVIVNTIFCGNHEEGIQTSWRHGATLTGGSYMSINQDRKTVYIPTPYDDKIDVLNDQLNETYLYYGSSGKDKKELQMTQDKNAESYSKANKVERTICKSSHVYKNSTWDLVDAARENNKILSETPAEHLPSEMRTMTIEERKSYVKEKSDQRKRIQSEIQRLSESRQQYIATHKPAASTDMLDVVMMNAVRAQAKSKSLSWPN